MRYIGAVYWSALSYCRSVAGMKMTKEGKVRQQQELKESIINKVSVIFISDSTRACRPMVI